MHNLKDDRILGIVKISLVHNRDTPHRHILCNIPVFKVMIGMMIRVNYNNKQNVYTKACSPET